MSEQTGSEALDIQALAAQMLSGGPNEDVYDDGDEDDDNSQQGHPAWQEILNVIPPELHNQVIPTLQKWDTGVSRQFQKIHDSYSGYREFEDLDPSDIREALGVYEALNSNPEATWEAIGRVYGLSPQQVSQAMSSDDEDELDDLPAGVRDRLARLDVHEQVLEAVTDEMLRRQTADTEAQEDEELEEYLEELREEYGDYDEDFVVGLIAAGIDGEQAVEQYQEMVQNIAQQFGGGQQRQYSPNVISGNGGIPNTEQVDPYKLSNSQTQDLVAEILRMTNES